MDLINSHCSDENVFIFTDSKNVKTIFNKRGATRSSRLAVPAFEALDQYRGKVTFIWTKAHSSQWGNDLADALAKRAALEPDNLTSESRGRWMRRPSHILATSASIWG